LMGGVDLSNWTGREKEPEIKQVPGTSFVVNNVCNTRSSREVALRRSRGRRRSISIPVQSIAPDVHPELEK
jgi:hypothetical protein